MAVRQRHPDGSGAGCHLSSTGELIVNFVDDASAEKAPALKVVAVFSGGLDSTTLLYHLRDAGHDVAALAIDYGQRHRRELASAQTICDRLSVPLTTLDLRSLGAVFGANSLSDERLAVPEGHYETESMHQTTVPNRNMILLSVAIGWAISHEFNAVAYGAHSGPYTPYPDCRPEFASAMDAVAGTCDWQPVRVLAPFIGWSKADIVRRGVELAVPFELTWSCYVGGDRPCGRCGTCLDRAEAFSASGLDDPAIARD